MRAGLGQQLLVALAVVGGVVLTLTIGYLLTRSDAGRPLGGPPLADAATLTPLASDTPTLTPTSALMTGDTPTATQRPLLVATDTPVATANMPTAAEPACGPPAGWTTYTVQPGENLFRIGLRYGQRVDAMLQANCLESEQLKSGQTLYVPPVTSLPPTPTATPPTIATPDPDETPTLVPGCSDPDAQLTAPAAGSVLTDIIFFFGTANIDNFNFYKLEVRPAGSTDDYITFDGSESPVEADFLGQVAAYAFPPGDYVVRLAVVDNSSVIVSECSITVTLQGGQPATATPDQTPTMDAG